MHEIINMKKIILFVVFISIGMGFASKLDWGFFGHRTINEIACYTLPQELFAFYKPYVTFVKEHAVDPDMRRYALKKEAGRHYIDIDYWGEPPFDILPRDWPTAFNKMLEISYVNGNLDTILLKPTRTEAPDSLNIYFTKHVKPNYFSDEWSFDCALLNRYFPNVEDCRSVIVHDSLTVQGILPYGLYYTYRQLTSAFEKKDVRRVLRHSADIGHYIGDAHVPLHTTVNYNGQLTNQDGIHAFWESRLPELYAMESYDLFSGQADYIADVNTYFWDVIMDTHTYLDSVLLIEQRLRETFPSDQQFCFEERLNRTIRLQCRAFAEAYHDAMDGMVERQMVKSIKAVGSIWYTAWVDAGQPDMTDIEYTARVRDTSYVEDYMNTTHH